MMQNLAKNGGGGGSGLPYHAALDKRLCITVPEAAEMLGLSRSEVNPIKVDKIRPPISYSHALS